MIKQVGGDHYAAEYQHWDWAAETQLGYLESAATKYVSRWRKKGGVQDLEKALSYVRKLELIHRLIGLVPAGLRPGRSEERRERFLDSTGVGAGEAAVVRLIDTWTDGNMGLELAAHAIQRMIDSQRDPLPDPTGHPAPFGYEGEG